MIPFPWWRTGKCFCLLLVYKDLIKAVVDDDRYLSKADFQLLASRYVYKDIHYDTFPWVENREMLFVYFWSTRT